jgi:hypothetical protein
MPAAAATTQELLEKAQALQSMLSELQNTVTAVRRHVSASFIMGASIYHDLYIAPSADHATLCCACLCRGAMSPPGALQ